MAQSGTLDSATGEGIFGLLSKALLLLAPTYGEKVRVRPPVTRSRDVGSTAAPAPAAPAPAPAPAPLLPPWPGCSGGLASVLELDAALSARVGTASLSDVSATASPVGHTRQWSAACSVVFCVKRRAQRTICGARSCAHGSDSTSHRGTGWRSTVFEMQMAVGERHRRDGTANRAASVVGGVAALTTADLQRMQHSGGV